MRLLLIRHAQTSSNVEHHLDTAEPGAGLTDFGWRQAQAIPDALAHEQIGLLCVSTLLRTQQTATPLADRRRLRLRVEPGIREIAAGDLEMCNDKASMHRYVETVFGWDHDLDRQVPGGETGRQVLARFDVATRTATREASRTGGETLAFVSHGAVIRVWTALRAENVNMEFAATHWLPNTGLVVVEGHPDHGWSMTSWGECALGGPELSDPAHTGPAGEPEIIADDGEPAVAEGQPGGMRTAPPAR